MFIRHIAYSKFYFPVGGAKTVFKKRQLNAQYSYERKNI